MIEIDMLIHHAVNESDGIKLVGQNHETVKILLNEFEKELLKEVLQEKV